MPMRPSVGHAAVVENVPPSSLQAPSSRPIVSSTYSSHFDVFVILLQVPANAAPDFAASLLASLLLPQPAAIEAKINVSARAYFVVFIVVSPGSRVARSAVGGLGELAGLGAAGERLSRALPRARDAFGVAEV